MKAKVFEGGLLGGKSPEIHRKGARESDDDLFSPATTGLLVFGLPFFPSIPIGLPSDESPSGFHEVVAQESVAVFVDGAQAAVSTATGFAGAESGVAADLAPVVEAGEVADFSLDHAPGESSEAFGSKLFDDGFFFELAGEGLELCLDGEDDFTQGVEEFEELRFLLLSAFPEFALPPLSFQTDGPEEGESTATLGVALDFLFDGFAQPSKSATLLFFYGGDAQDIEDSVVAAVVVFDSLAEDFSIPFVGFDAVFVFSPTLGSDDVTGHSHGVQLSIEDESKGTGFITSDYFGSGLLLFGNP